MGEAPQLAKKEDMVVISVQCSRNENFQGTDVKKSKEDVVDVRIKVSDRMH